MNSVPKSLITKRGARAAILRLWPRLWFQLPQTSELAVPPLTLPRVAAFNPELSASTGSHIFDGLQSPAVNQADTCWEVICREILLVLTDIHVSGILYRSKKQPDEICTPGAVNPKQIQLLLEESDRKQTVSNNFYAHLYSLLYPPPDEFAVGQIPKYSELYSYQKQGVEFLVSHEHALLADDMGLGKTAQCSVAMQILLKSERVRRALVICPRALIRQWEQEALRWAGLYARPVDGTPVERKRMWKNFPGAMLATPQVVLNDIETIAENHFDLVVCDDVSMLKNPGKITSAIRKIPRTRSWCLNGTPLENKPEDFANIMEFVKPELFSSQDRRQAPSQHELQSRVQPYFLRRRKVDCLEDLPPKQLIGPIPLQMDNLQWEAYRRAELQQWQQLQSMGVKTTKIHVFALINLLLKLCNYDEASGQSAKSEAISERLDIIFDGSDKDVKVIVFSRWVDTLEFLEQKWARYSPQVYHGGLSEAAREKVLNWFKNEGRLLLISTKAGSRGLNLQEASYVFHFDRTWNPADEMQAEDRCWRKGQKRTVFVYRYTQENTIEMRIDEVLTQKKGQFDAYVDSMAENTDAFAEKEWSLNELIEIMRPSEKS